MEEAGYRNLIDMAGGFQGGDDGPPFGPVDGWQTRGYEMTREARAEQTWEHTLERVLGAGER